MNTRVSPHDTLYAFVRHQLGCACPEDVLRSITRSDDALLPEVDGPLTRLEVGGQLLVYVLPADRSPRELGPVVRAAIEGGVRERDRLGFNRLRLVLAVTERRDLGTAAAAAAAVAGSTPAARAHIHVLESARLPFGIGQ